jgi:threonine dehydratase
VTLILFIKGRSTNPRIKNGQTRLYGEPEIICHGRDITAAMERVGELQDARGSVFITVVTGGNIDIC